MSVKQNVLGGAAGRQAKRIRGNGGQFELAGLGLCDI